MGWLTFHKPKGVKAVDAILDSVGRDWAAKKVVAKYLDTFRVERHRTRTAKNGTYFRSVATGTLCNIPASRLANSEVIEVDLVRAPTVA